MTKKQIDPKSAKSLTSAQKCSNKQNKRFNKKKSAVIKQLTKFTGAGPRARAVVILNTGKSSKFESVFLGLAAALPDSVKDNVSKLLKRLLSDFKETRDAASKQLHDAANSQSAVNVGGISEFLDYCEKHSDLGIMNDVISLMLRKCHEEYLKSWRRSTSKMKDTHEQENETKGCNKEYECENDSNTATTSSVASETKDESCSSEDEGLEAGCSG